MGLIHPTAIIEDGADLHDNVSVGAYSIVEAGAVVGEGCVIDSNARIYATTRMGRFNRVCHGATIGTEPQDLSYTPTEDKPLVIGDHNHFKECVNISRGRYDDRGTIIGDHNYLMTFSHVGHDCVVGDYNILANTATLAGHVRMAHHIFLSGQVAVHQFCRIGAYVMVGGISGVNRDVPPFVTANGQRAVIRGLNLVGLRRNGFDQAQRSAIKRAYRILYKSNLRREEVLQRLRDDADSAEVRQIVAFVETSERGLLAHA